MNNNLKFENRFKMTMYITCIATVLFVVIPIIYTCFSAEFFYSLEKIQLSNNVLMIEGLLLGMMFVSTIISVTYILIIPQYSVITFMNLFDMSLMIHLFLNMSVLPSVMSAALFKSVHAEFWIGKWDMFFLFLAGYMGTILANVLYNPDNYTIAIWDKFIACAYLVFALGSFILPNSMIPMGMIAAELLLLGTFLRVIFKFRRSCKLKLLDTYRKLQMIKTLYLGCIIFVDILTFSNNNRPKTTILIHYIIFFLIHVSIRAYEYKLPFVKVAKLNENLEKKVDERTKELRQANQNLKNLNEKDTLTGLHSEYGFLTTVQKILKESDTKYSIISVDIDNFKYINELYGYEIGTKVIAEVGKHFQKQLVYAKVIARVHADQYLFLIPKENEEDTITICGKGKCKECSKHLLGNEYNLDTSIGVYHINDASLSLPYMIDCANHARTLGKGIYGRTYTMFTKETEESLKQKNDIVQTMIQAVERNEFKLFYQPKIDLKNNQVTSAEALVRWIKMDGTQVFPDDFIPLFEKNGFIQCLDYYVFHQVCEFLNKHREVPKIAVNLSGVTLLDIHLVNKLCHITETHKIECSRIELEITESAIVENFGRAVPKILQLKQCGFTISMDDFGAGVSSLNRLKEIYIDVLKIDKKFLVDSLIEERGKIIIENIICLAKKLGVKVVAEGVETAEQVKMLQEFECDMAQGYYYEKPVSEDEFLKLLECGIKKNL